MIRDMIQFGAIFAVFLFSFSGAFYLALRGEVHSQEESDCIDCNDTLTDDASSVSALNTSLNIYPFETSYVGNNFVILFNF